MLVSVSFDVSAFELCNIGASYNDVAVFEIGERPL